MSGASPPSATNSPFPAQSASAAQSAAGSRPIASAAGSSVRSVGIISGGVALGGAERRAMAEVDLVIAVDSGFDLALDAELRVDLVLGDFDSVSPAALARAEDAGIELLRFGADKDETDLELALIRAIDSEPARIVVVGLVGGRPDHALSSLLLLADPRWSPAMVIGYVGDAIVTVLRGGIDPNLTRHRFDHAGRGTLVSLIPVGGDAYGVSTAGMRWPLVDETLPAHSPRGMSNVIEGDWAEVSLRAGTLLAFQPSAAPAPDGDR